jgi:hypothetical protein
MSHYIHNPRKGHMSTVFHILRNLKSALEKGLIFRNNWHMNIEGYCDSDWTSCQDDRRFTSGYSMFVGGNLVSWQSKKQPIIARSIAETKYRVMTLEIAEMLWLKRLLKYLKVNHEAKMKLWCYSMSAINITNNHMQHDKTKHVEIDRFFIKKKLKSGVLDIK